MTSQQLKRANEIEEEIKEVLHHKGSIVRYKLEKAKIISLTNITHNFSIPIRLSYIPSFDIAQFLEDYLSTIDKRIEKLEEEFVNL